MLDDHELQRIKVTSTDSILFGNSHSHFSKKLRLRRLTWKKTSMSSMALLDKEGNPDMKSRVHLTPLIYVGLWLFVPLVVVGAVLDIWVYLQSNGTFAMALTAVGLVFYVLSFFVSIRVLKTEKKAQ